jgi:hypothetical protein
MRGDEITRQGRQRPLPRHVEAGKARDALVGQRDLASLGNRNRLNRPRRDPAGRRAGKRRGRRQGERKGEGRAGAAGWKLRENRFHVRGALPSRGGI